MIEMLTLAQGGGSVDLAPLLVWVGVGVGVVIILGMVVMAIRRQALNRNSLVDSGTMLDQIRSMRDQGEISPEEFDAIRATLIAKTKASLAEMDQQKHSPQTSYKSLTKGPPLSQTQSPAQSPIQGKSPTPLKSDGTQGLDRTGDKGL